mgnify:CR=1 FL=1
MKEEDLKKAIKLKEQIDSERELLRFANSSDVNLRVNLEERSETGRIRNMNYLLGDNVVKELNAKVIANIKKNISELLDKLEKL